MVFKHLFAQDTGLTSLKAGAESEIQDSNVFDTEEEQSTWRTDKAEQDYDHDDDADYDDDAGDDVYDT